MAPLHRERRSRKHARGMRRWLFGTASLLFVIAVAAALVVGSVATAQVVPPPPSPPPSEPPPDDQPPPPPPAAQPAPSYPPLPADSGHGRRIVYSVSEQRVWLVEATEQPSASWL